MSGTMLEIRREVLRGKKTTRVLLAGVIALGLISGQAGAAEAGGGFTTVFSVPPFKVGETVLGIDDWTAGTKSTEERPETVTVESLAGGDQKTGLLVQSYGIDKRLSDTLAGQVRVTAVFNFNEFGLGRLIIAPMMGGRIDVFDFGYLADAKELDPNKSGFSYLAQSADENPDDANAAPRPRQMLVPRSDLIEGQPYTLTADIDFAMQTVTISVTGKKADGTALQVSVPDVSFLGRWNPQSLTGVRILGGGSADSARILLESISAKSISH